MVSHIKNKGWYKMQIARWLTKSRKRKGPKDFFSAFRSVGLSEKGQGLYQEAADRVTDGDLTHSLLYLLKNHRIHPLSHTQMSTTNEPQPISTRLVH